MTINIENNVFAEIGAGLTSGTLLLNVKGGKETLFPPAPFPLNLVKFNSTGTVLLREIVNVTSKAGNIFTITRAYEPVPVNDAALTTSQVAYDFDEGDMIYMTFTAGMLETMDTDIQSRLPKSGGQLSGRVDFAKGANIASASTVNLATATGNTVHITGNTTITALGTVQTGSEMCLIFDGILILTHNATSLILPTGANITTQVGDSVYMKSEGSGNWRCTGYQRADGSALVVTTGMTGEVKMWTSSVAPGGWNICDGSAISRTTYATLFSIIGTTFGIGNGSTTFNIPDFRGRSPLGSGTGTATGATAHALGSTPTSGAGGEEKHTLTEAEMPSHTHTVPGGNGGVDGLSHSQQGFIATTSITTGSTGTGTAHNIMSPHITINFIIKT